MNNRQRNPIHSVLSLVRSRTPLAIGVAVAMSAFGVGATFATLAKVVQTDSGCCTVTLCDVEVCSVCCQHNGVLECSFKNIGGVNVGICKCNSKPLGGLGVL